MALGIRSVGAVTAVGEDAPSTVGSIITEAQAFDRLPVKGPDGRLAMGASTPIPLSVKGVDRLAALAAYALREATEGLPRGSEVGLAVCAPTEDAEPGLAGCSSAFLSRLAAHCDGIAIEPAASRLFPHGRKAVLGALAFAQSALRAREMDAVCVLGVDSLVTEPRLGKALRCGAAPTRSLPGEAAAALLLTRRLASDQMAILAGFGTALEPGWGDRAKEPNRGRGFISAIGKAASEANLVGPAFAALVHDLPPTTAWDEELTWVRGCPSFRTSPEPRQLAPAASVGEIGAASGILSLASLAFLIGQKTVNGTGLCLIAAEGAHRGAAILLPPPARRSAPR